MPFVDDFMPDLHKHSKRLDLVELVSSVVDKIQRNFEPLKRQTEVWQSHALDDDWVKFIHHAANVEGWLDAPRRLLTVVHGHNSIQSTRPSGRGLCGHAQTYTSAFKKLRTIRQFQATAKLAAFLGSFDGAGSLS